jgi:PIN domain nuclease of toxin-antitoxin system
VTVVLDTSAVLAVIFGEDGADRVLPHLTRSTGMISAVNVAEIAAKLVDKNYSDEDAKATLGGLRAIVRGFDADAAVAAGLLRRQTRERGLSLGDRACLALARTHRCPAVTADRNWREVADAARVQIELIR